MAPGCPIGGDACVQPDGTLVAGDQRLELRVAGSFELVQRYLAGTPVFETVVVTDHGSTGFTDLVWEGRTHRLLRRYTGSARVEADGAVEDPELRLAALRGWFERLPPFAGPDRELRMLSAALVAACQAEPGGLRDPAEVDDLGLWRLPDGAVDLRAHAAFALLD